MAVCLDYPQANEMLELRKRRTNQSSLTHQTGQFSQRNLLEVSPL